MDYVQVIIWAHQPLFFEKGTTGGVSYISNTYGKAHNKHLKSYDQKQESKHITYLDANNLGFY